MDFFFISEYVKKMMDGFWQKVLHEISGYKSLWFDTKIMLYQSFSLIFFDLRIKITHKVCFDLKLQTHFEKPHLQNLGYLCYSGVRTF